MHIGTTYENGSCVHSQANRTEDLTQIDDNAVAFSVKAPGGMHSRRGATLMATTLGDRLKDTNKLKET